MSLIKEIAKLTGKKDAEIVEAMSTLYQFNEESGMKPEEFIETSMAQQVTAAIDNEYIRGKMEEARAKAMEDLKK